jgi:hypothetical protein
VSLRPWWAVVLCPPAFHPLDSSTFWQMPYVCQYPILSPLKLLCLRHHSSLTLLLLRFTPAPWFRQAPTVHIVLQQTPILDFLCSPLRVS